MSIRLICASAKNNVIGNENKLPWNISEDLKRFKELTSENIIVMGRKTYESIGRPLPKRKNIVLSRNKNLEIQGVEVMNSIESVIDSYNLQEKDLYVIGGTFIYELFLEHLYLNHLEQANLQITREPLKLPFIKINPSVKNLEDFKYEDFEIIDYESHPAISAPISV